MTSLLSALYMQYSEFQVCVDNNNFAFSEQEMWDMQILFWFMYLSNEGMLIEVNIVKYCSEIFAWPDVTEAN